MKGYKTKFTTKKLIVSLLVVIAMILAPASTLVKNLMVYADAYNDLTAKTLSVSKFDADVVYGEKYYLPEVSANVTTLSNTSASGTNGVFYTITAPNGSDVETSNDTYGYFFTANMRGVYTLNVYYQATDGVKVVASDLKVTVNAEDFSLVDKVNNQNVIPTKMPKGLTLVIPTPDIYKGDEQYTLTSETLNLQIISGATTFTTADECLTLNSTTGNYEWNTSLDAVTSAKTYQILFTLVRSGVILASTAQTVKVVASDDFIDDIKLTLNNSFNKSVEGVLGKEVTLPKTTVYDKNSDSTSAIPAYIDITIKCRTTDADGNTVTIDYNDKDTVGHLEGYTFTPMHEGSYDIVYSPRIPLFENSGLTTTDNQKITLNVFNPTDENPNALVVNNYTVTEGKITAVGTTDTTSMSEAEILELMGDLSNTIPAYKVGAGTITLPAIYASDNLTYGYSNYTLNRTVCLPSSSQYNTLSHVVGEETVAYNPNEAATYTFTTDSAEGTYKFQYEVKDSNGNGNTKLVIFSVKYVKVAPTDTAPEVEIIGLPTRIYDNATLTIPSSKIIVSDPNVDSDNVNLTVEAVAFNGDIQLSNTIVLELNDDNNYVLDLTTADFNGADEGLGTYNFVSIKATANNLYADPVIILSNKITVLNTNDTVAPVFAETTNTLATSNDIAGINFTHNAAERVATGISNTGYLIYTDGGTEKISDVAPFNQGDYITLPSFTIADTDLGLAVSVKIARENGSNVSMAYDPANKEPFSVKYNTTNFSVVGGQFLATYAGVYTVTYVAKDIAGNLTYYSFGIRVNDTEAPTVYSADTTNVDCDWKLNVAYEIPTAIANDNGTKTSIDTWELIEWPSGSDYPSISSFGFTPNATGVYKFRYFTTDGAGNTGYSNEYFINVTDDEKPIIILNDSLGYFATNTLQSEIAWTDGGVDVVIPFGTAIDNDINSSAVTVKVTDASGNVKTTSNYDTDGNLKFTATKQSIYTITYTATDDAGNTTTVTKTISVGDTVSPTLTWADGVTVPSEVELDGTLIIKPTDFSVADEGTGVKTTTVTLTNPKGTTVTNDWSDEGTGYKYTMSVAGDYTLKVVVTDKAGNKTTKSYTISVAEASTESNTNVSNTVGTILIILAVVVLAGVVIYFIVSSRKLSKKSNKNTK